MATKPAVNDSTPATPAAPAAAPADLPEQSSYDAFTEAFAEAVAPETGTPPAAPETPPAAPETPPAEPKTPAEPPETAPVEGEEGAETAEIESPEAKIARLEAENATLKAVPKPQKEAISTEKTGEIESETTEKAPETPAEPKWYTLEADEKTALAEFQKEWPDIAKAQDIALKQAVYNGVQYVFNALAKTYNPTLERFSELSELMQEQLTLGALRGAHSDYDRIQDDVRKWVDTLPSFMKRTAKATLEDGTVEEVNDLIAEYKKSHPTTATQAAVIASVASVTPKPTELSAAAKKAATKLSAVGSKRTTPVEAADANDFDGAWTEALKSG
jgi:hypothetical protein